MIRLAVILCLLGWSARAEVIARIDLSDQEMTVFRDGRELYRWPISTARAGKFTPKGTFLPQTLKRVHYSTIYNGAPMPWSIFFTGNFAVHGTDQIERLGTPASAGCVRLHPDNAEILFNMVLEDGKANTRILVQD